MLPAKSVAGLLSLPEVGQVRPDRELTERDPLRKRPDEDANHFGGSNVRRGITALAITVFTILASAPASADYNGGGGDAPPLTPTEALQSQVKTDIANAYLQHRKAGGRSRRHSEGPAHDAREHP